MCALLVVTSLKDVCGDLQVSLLGVRFVKDRTVSSLVEFPAKS
jgi:hypothetical protein